MALWVEKHHGDAGHDFMAGRIEELSQAGEHEGAKLWRQVASRFTELRTGPIPIHGQDETQPN